MTVLRPSPGRSPAVRAMAVLVLVVALIGSLAGASTVARADAPVRPDRDQAREWAVRELLGQEYQRHRPGVIQRLWGWLRDWLSRLELPHGVPGTPGTVIVAALLAVVVGYLLWRTGSLRRRGSGPNPDGVFADPGSSAADHASAADAAEAAGDYRTAVIERFRALVRGLQERALVELHPGRTADEAVRAAAGWLPELAGELAAAARAFDDVRYGELPATAGTAARLRDLDERVRRARPSGSAAVPADSGAPR